MESDHILNYFPKSAICADWSWLLSVLWMLPFGPWPCQWPLLEDLSPCSPQESPIGPVSVRFWWSKHCGGDERKILPFPTLQTTANTTWQLQWMLLNCSALISLVLSWFFNNIASSLKEMTLPYIFKLIPQRSDLRKGHVFHSSAPMNCFA